MILTLSHGHVQVEGGFSVNKNVLRCNMSQDTIVALRIVNDQLNYAGDILKVSITSDLMKSVGKAKMRYDMSLSEAKTTDEVSKKRKAIEDELTLLKNLKKKRKLLKWR